MDLKPFVGRRVMLQFKPSVGYAIITTLDRAMAPLVMKGQDGSAHELVAPYIDGMVEEYDGLFFISYSDRAVPGQKLKVTVSPELIGFVTVVGEKTEPSRIVFPGA